MTGSDETRPDGLIDGWFKPLPPPAQTYRGSHAAPDEQAEPVYVPEVPGYAPYAPPQPGAYAPPQPGAYAPLEPGAYAPPQPGAAPQQWAPPPPYGSPDWAPGYPISGPYFDQPRGGARSSRRRLLSVLVVVALVLAGSGYWYVRIRPHVRGPHRVLVVPEAFGSYHRISSPNAQQVIDQMRTNVESMGTSAKWADAYKDARIGLYTATASSQPQLVFIALDATDNAQARELFMHGTPSSNAHDFMDGATMTEQATFDAGSLGGTLRCGHTTYESVLLSACVWMDQSTFGFVIDNTGATSDSLAATLVTLRGAAEH